MKQIKQLDNSFIAPLTNAWPFFSSWQALEPDVIFLRTNNILQTESWTEHSDIMLMNKGINIYQWMTIYQNM